MSAIPPGRPLSVTYLLEDTPLFGGVKVVLAQANLLAARGHRVSVVSRGERPTWFELKADFRRVPDLDPAHLPESDVVVATYWTTIAAALAAPARERAHYCQGFEGSYTHNVEDHPRILDAYSHLLPALVVSPHLGLLLRERFGRPSRTVTQPLDAAFRPRWRRAPKPVPVVVLVGPREIDWKGIDTGLAAVAEMRRAGMTCRLVRISQWPATDRESEATSVEEFHSHLPPRLVAPILRRGDLLLAPSWTQEGFGLPALEAMASGVPVVASDIPCYRGFAAEAASLVPPRDASAFAAAARELLLSPSRWRAARRRGRAVAARFSARRAAESAESALRWVATGAWRGELESSLPAGASG